MNQMVRALFRRVNSRPSASVPLASGSVTTVLWCSWRMSLKGARGSFLFAIAVFFFACVGLAQSGTTVKGTVVDETGAPIPGANVMLLSDDRVRATSADRDGTFLFRDLAAPADYVIASSPGFFPSSAPTKDNGNSLAVTLEVGSFSQCRIIAYSSADLEHPTASYQERSGTEQLMGIVDALTTIASDQFYDLVRAIDGPPLARTTLTLYRSDLTAPLSGANARRNYMMEARSFKETMIAVVTSNEDGEFQFGGLEPGWYRLDAAHDGYREGTAKFWIARENLTKLSRFHLALKSQPVPCSVDRPI